MLVRFEHILDGYTRPARFLTYTTTLLVVAVCLLMARKVWETNDDVGIAMVSQGYGIAGAPSAGVIFANVIWGWMLAHTPSFARVDGYSLLNYIALLAAATAMLISMVRGGVNVGLACAAVLVMTIPILLTPQFTVLAGYLSLAGFAVLLAWREQPTFPSLLWAGCLLFTAALVRQMEMLFVAAVAAPFLLSTLRAPVPRRRWLILAAVLLSAMGAAKLVDHTYYTDASWAQFRAMNTDRVAFTDYRLGAYYGRHPKLVRSVGLEPNDIALISRWFYADPKVFQPAKFDVLRHGVPPMERVSLNLSHLRGDVAALATSQLLLLCGLLAILVALVRRNLLALSASITVVLGASLALCFMGRMGLTRVYVPVVAAVPVLYLCACAQHINGVRWFGIAAFATAVAASAFWIVPRLGDHPADHRIEAAVCALPTDRLNVVWGAHDWPYILLHRPGQGRAQACAPRFYALGSMQLAPFSLDTVREATGYPDLVSALLAGKGIYLFTDPDRLPILKRYFAYHYHKVLTAREIVDIPHLHGYAVEVGGEAQASDTDEITLDDDAAPPG